MGYVIYPLHVKFLLTRLSRGVTFVFCKPSEPNTFLLTRLSRGVTVVLMLIIPDSGFLLTRLSRGVTVAKMPPNVPIKISTHTPLARRDWAAV